jgi:hypothetical protein
VEHPEIHISDFEKKKKKSFQKLQQDSETKAKDDGLGLESDSLQWGKS